MSTRRKHIIVAVILATLIVSLGVSGIAAAAQESKLGGKVRAGTDVIVPVGETVKGNLYAAGRTVRVEGTVDGDLVATGGTIDVPGKVTGDAILAGGQISLAGEIGGDARVAGGQITVDGTINGDLVLGGGRATVSSTGKVAQDFMFSGGQISLGGAVAGSVLGNAGNYTKTGTVSGSEQVSVGQPKQGQPTATARILGFVRTFVSVLLVGALFLWLLPALISGPEWRVRSAPLSSLGFGVGGLIALLLGLLVVLLIGVLLAVILGLLGFTSPLVAIILSITMAWLVMGFVVYLVAAFLAPAIVGVVIGNVILWRRPEPVAGRPFGALALGVLIVVALMTIPIVGGWIGYLVFSFGLGGLLLWAWRRLRQPKQAQPTFSAQA